MHRFDPPDVTCLIFTRKEGLLSRVAHDLCLQARRVTLDLDARTVIVQADSIGVLHAMQGDQPAPDRLSAKDKREIERNIGRDVLDSARFSQITFRWPAGAVPAAEGSVPQRVQGELTLHGRSRPVTLVVIGNKEGARATCDLHQPDFGIKPYSAAFGTLKVKPTVTVVATMSAAVVAALGARKG